jgi:hypothetical protein
VAELRRRLAQGPSTAAQGEDFRAFVAREIEPYNVAGLCDPNRRNMYPYLD